VAWYVPQVLKFPISLQANSNFFTNHHSKKQTIKPILIKLDSSLFLTNITLDVSEVDKGLGYLRSNHRFGPDSISAKVLYECRATLFS